MTQNAAQLHTHPTMHAQKHTRAHTHTHTHTQYMHELYSLRNVKAKSEQGYMQGIFQE